MLFPRRFLDARRGAARRARRVRPDRRRSRRDRASPAGAAVDGNGRYTNAEAIEHEILLQVWTHDAFSEDQLVGEATVTVAELMHGAATRFQDLSIRDDAGAKTGTVAATFLLEPA